MSQEIQRDCSSFAVNNFSDAVNASAAEPLLTDAECSNAAATAAAIPLDSTATTSTPTIVGAVAASYEESSGIPAIAIDVDGWSHHQNHPNQSSVVAAGFSAPSSADTTVHATTHHSNNNNNPQGAAIFQSNSQQRNQAQEEKEEITDLAALPTVGFGTIAEPATVIRNGTDDDNDDEELARLKRAAYYGHQHDVVPDREPQPEPLSGEDFAAFYARTIDHWNILAAERLTGSGDDLTLDTLEDESTRMASQRWQQMQPAMNAEATVVSITEGDVHPSDLGAIQAEWVRYGTAAPDASTTATSPLANDGRHHIVPPLSGTAVATAIEDETTTEATVIDTAPLAKEEGREVWQAAEEAQVLGNVTQTVEQNENDDDEDDRKPPASSGQITPQPIAPSEYPSNVTNQQQQDEYAVADQEGVVLAIEDDVHPCAFAGDDANAQVVGADFGYAVSNDEAMSINTPQASVTAEAVARVESGRISSPAEVQAILVEHNSTIPVEAVTATPTVTNPDSGGAQRVSVLPTESITVENDSDIAFESALNKEVPWSGTPSGGGSGGGEHETTLDEFVEHNSSPPPPPRESFGNSPREQSAQSGNSEKSSSSQRSQLHNLSTNIVRSTGNVMDALFGDTKGPFVGRKTRASENEIANSVVSRTLLPWSVIFSPANKMWVATIQTSQKALDSNDITEASKALRAFSLPTEKQAISLARAWTPPRMMTFRDSPACHICKSKFAVFRRPCHCRNCGVCICKDCAVQWPSNMVPDTYNTKDEACVNACKSCDWISNAFRLALLNGNMDEAVAINATGNINVTCPFSNVKGELFYPVHCAVLGGNLHLLRWLVDECCCPIKSVRVSGRSRDSAGRYTPIVTSKGRSLLGIAMENCYLNIVRYLVVKKGIVIAGERDITHEMLSRNLTKILRNLPDDSPDEMDAAPPPETAEFTASAPSEDALSPAVPDPENNIRSLSDGARDFGAIYQHRDTQASATGEAADECIICFDGKIDCVATPCGHQICCLRCSQRIKHCPVCAQDCSFMRVFKP